MIAPLVILAVIVAAASSPPRRRRPGLDLGPNFNPQAGRSVVFDGMPDASVLPPGWEVVDVSTYYPGSEGQAAGWGPRPDRFRQYDPVWRAQQRGVALDSDAVAAIRQEVTDDLRRNYFFTVVGGDVGWGEFALGKRVDPINCCDIAVYRQKKCTSSGSKVTCTDQLVRYGAAGPIASPFICELQPNECWVLLPRPFIDWPESG